MDVAIRMRPLLTRESGLPCLWSCENNTIYSSKGGKANNPYSFDHVYSPTTQNTTVYHELVEKIVSQSMQGYHGTVFTYGQSGSGKTYTMDALTKLALDTMYEYIDTHTERQFILRVSYIELYNEHLFDLLAQKEGGNLIVREDIEKTVYIEGLLEELVNCKEDALSYISFGNEKRRFAETKQNDFSSRAHCILRIIIESVERDEPECSSVLLSHLNLVDLAGSEKAAENSGDRMREGCHINKSLLALSMVVKKLSEEQNNAHINYRDSKLTRILQNSLGGNSRTAILCTISPTSFEETLSTLRFANNARYVKNKPQQNMIMSVAAQLKEALKQIDSLKDKIKKLQKADLCLCEKEEKQVLPTIPDNSMVDPQPFNPAVVEMGSRRKSMFVDDVKSRRRSFFVTSRSRRKVRESNLQLNESGFADPNDFLSLLSRDSNEEPLRQDCISQVAERSKDSSFQSQGSQDGSSTKEENMTDPHDSFLDKNERQEVSNDPVRQDMEIPINQEISNDENTDALRGKLAEVANTNYLREESTNDGNNDALQEELKQMREEFEASLDKIQSLQNIIERGKDMLSKKNLEIQALVERVGELQGLNENGVRDAKDDESSTSDEKVVLAVADTNKQEDQNYLNEEIQQLKQELDDKDNKLTGSQNTIQLLEDKTEKLEDLLCEKEDELQDFIQKLEIQNSHRQEECGSLNEEMEKLKQELKDKDTELIERQNSLQIAEETARQLRAFNEKELQDSVQTIEGPSFSDSNEQELYVSLKEEMNQLRQRLDDQDKELSTKQNTIQSLQNFIERGKEMLSNKDLEIQTLEERIEELQVLKQNDDAGADIEKPEMLVAPDMNKEDQDCLNEEIKQLKQELDEKDNKLTGSQYTIQLLEDKTEQLEDLLCEKEDELQDFIQKLEIQNSHKQECGNVNEEMVKLKQELKDKDTELIEKQNLLQIAEETARQQESVQNIEESSFSDSNEQELYVSLKEEMNQLRQRLDDQDKELSTKQNTIQMMEKAIGQQEQVLFEKDCMLKEFQKEAQIQNNMKQEYDCLVAKMGQLNQVLCEKDNDLIERQNLLQTTEETLKKLKQLCHEKDIEIQESNQRIEMLALNGSNNEENHVCLQEEMRQLRQKLVHQDNELCTRQNTIQMMEEKMTRENQLFNEKENLFQELQNKVEIQNKETQKESCSLNEEMKQLKQELYEKDNELIRRQNELQVVEERERQLKEMYAEKETQLLKSIQKIEMAEERERQLTELNDEKEIELKHNIEKIESQNKMNREEYGSMNGEMENLKQELHEKDNELKERQNLLQMAEGRERQLKQLYDENEIKLQQSIKKIESQNKMNREEYGSMNGEMENLKQELHEKDNELKERQNLLQMAEGRERQLKQLYDENEIKLQQSIQKTEMAEEKERRLKEMYDENKIKLQKSIEEMELLSINDCKDHEEYVNLKEEMKLLRRRLDDQDNELSGRQDTIQMMMDEQKKLLHEKDGLLQELQSKSEIQSKMVQEKHGSMCEEMERLKQELHEKDNELKDRHNLLQMAEERERELKKLCNEKEIKLQEPVQNFEVPATNDGGNEREDFVSLKEEMKQLRQKLDDQDSELCARQDAIQTMEEKINSLKELTDKKDSNNEKLKEFIKKGHVAMITKNRANQTLTNTVESLTKEKKKVEKDCQRLEKSRQEDKEYYELVIERYKLKFRKTQHLDSSYLESASDPKPLSSSVPNASNSQSMPRSQDKENRSERVKELEDKLHHYESIIRDLRAQIPDRKREDPPPARPQAMPSLGLGGSGVVDYCLTLNKDHYIKKLEHKLKNAEAQLESFKGSK